MKANQAQLAAQAARSHQGTASQRASLRRELAEKERQLAEAERQLADTMGGLRAIVVKTAKEVLSMHAHRAGVTPQMTQAEARACVMGHLIGAEALEIHPGIVKIMADVGFDASRVTYGELSGQRIAYVDGLSLLKFVGFVHADAPTLKDAALDAAVGARATQH